MDELQLTGIQCKEPDKASPSPEESVTMFIERQLVSILDQLVLRDGKPCITLKKRHSSKQANYSLNPDTGALEEVFPACRAVSHTYSWPGKTAQETWRFAVILRILGHIYEAIKGEFTSTKRDVYYLDPVHFGNQAVVDRYVDDVAFTIGVDRAALHVQAAAKGLVAGHFTISLENGATINVGKFPEVNGAAPSVLVIIGDDHTIESSKACSQSSSLPPKILVLVDGDPDGISIMSTYKYGSLARAHENRNLNVPNIVWLGLQTSEFVMATPKYPAFRIHMPDSCNGGGGATTSNRENIAQKSMMQNFIKLRARDRKKATWMLSNSPVFAEDGPETGWRRELQVMMLLGVKAEIEALYDLDGGIDEWLDVKLKKAIHANEKD
ncbi:hypothetical protein KEM54_002357 [Ascosphaera aggregata]|nr:hypothetical protein KEM54_002357 [Ascosphaera aggregata]